MIITRTPYRISFLGGGTDYPSWFKDHGGSVLSTAIDKFAYISVRWLPPFFEHKHRIVWSQIENVGTIDEIHHPAVRECLRYMNISKGVEIHHDGDLPARTGMGTSSTFTVGLLNALHLLTHGPVSPEELAKEAIYIEQELIKDKVGNQDQIAAACGDLNFIEFLKDGTFDRSPLPIPYKRRRLFESHLMLIFTGFPHTSSEVSNTYTFEGLEEMSALVEEGKKILISGNIRDFGQLLKEGWDIKCRLSPKICTPWTAYLYKKAMDAGCLGAKLLGAGGGGFLLLFVEPEKQTAVREALQGLLCVPFHFEDKGTQVILNNGNF